MLPVCQTEGQKLFFSFPSPVPDNRASLLRPGTAPKKPLNEKDIWTHLWKNYIVFACRVVPCMSSGGGAGDVRCVSPELILRLEGAEGGFLEKGGGVANAACMASFSRKLTLLECN